MIERTQAIGVPSGWEICAAWALGYYSEAGRSWFYGLLLEGLDGWFTIEKDADADYTEEVPDV